MDAGRAQRRGAGRGPRPVGWARRNSPLRASGRRLDRRRVCQGQRVRADRGLLPDELIQCVDMILARFDVATAGVASYDPNLDDEGLIHDVAVTILEAAARDRTEPR
jgi:hypothetical protein